MSEFVDKQWFVDQSAEVVETVDVGNRKIRIKSLDYITKAEANAKAAALSKSGKDAEEIDAEKFAVNTALMMMIASIVDEAGNRIFTDSEEDLNILRKLRGRFADPIDQKIQELSYAPRAGQPLGN